MWVDVLLLSQLAARASHGYELRRRVEAATGIVLHNNSLYPALKRFGEAGAVTRTLEPQEGRPPRHVYALTDVGRELLHDLLADLPDELAGDEAEFLARLAGFGRLTPAERRGVLGARERVLCERRARVAGLAEAAAPGADDTGDPWASLVLDEVLRRIHHEQAWLEHLAVRVDDGPEPTTDRARHRGDPVTTVATSPAHDAADDLPRLPFPREGVLTISPLYERLRAAGPVTRVRTPAGDVAWLVSRYEEARTLFADRRLGRSHPRPEEAARVSDAGVMAGPSGDHEHEDADHASTRRLLTPAFSAKRMRLLHDRVAELADTLVDDLVAAHAGGADPLDLHAGFSVPLPIFVICELLGVPVEDRAYFKGLSERLATMTGDDPAVARDELQRYTGQLAEAKRARPGEDVISDLVAAQAQDPRLTGTRVAELIAGLLFAGHETTVNRLSLGVLLLLVNPEARDRLVTDPEGEVDGIVEEVLRLAEPGGMGLLRYAHDDVVVGEGDEQVTIAAGDAVVIVTSAANRDRDAFDDAEAFDPDRAPNPHLSFGHGPHFCIGASLARTELRVGLSTLFTRLPGLRAAVDPAELSLHTERLTGGLDELPVTW